MKKLLYLFVVLAPVCLFAQVDSSADEEALKNLIRMSFEEILSEVRLDKMDNYYTDDFLLLEHGEIWDNDTIITVMETYAAQEEVPVRKNKFDFISIKIFGDRAWMAYHNEAVFTRNGEVVRHAKWLESATAVRTENGWRLDMLHSTRKPSGD